MCRWRARWALGTKGYCGEDDWISYPSLNARHVMEIGTMGNSIDEMNVTALRIHASSARNVLGVPGVRSASNPAQTRPPSMILYGCFSPKDISNLESLANKTVYTCSFYMYTPNDPEPIFHYVVLAYKMLGSNIVYWIANDLDAIENRINRKERVDSATGALGELVTFVLALPASLLSMNDLKKANPIPHAVTRLPRKRDLEMYLGPTYRISP